MAEPLPGAVARIVTDVLRTTGRALRLQAEVRGVPEPFLRSSEEQHVLTIGSPGEGADPWVPSWTDAHTIPIVVVDLDGRRIGGFGFLWDDRDPETALVDLADQLQEFCLDEEIWGGWPLCPVHGTHLQAAVRDGTAVWACPRGETVATIGELPPFDARD
jgi:hypothetical protein